MVLHLINYEIVPGSNVGDHYASVMFKIIATYGSKGKIVSGRRFVLKTIPEAEGPKKEFLEQMPVFKNELLIYTTVLPAMEKILNDHGEKIWWPKLVFSQPSPFVLVFDDLTVEKYAVVQDELSFDRLGMIVDKLAKYHALSKVLIENGHENLTTFKLIFGEESKALFIPMSRVLSLMATEIQTWSGYEEVGRKLEKVIPNVVDKSVKCLTQDNSREFNVLNHGDFHIRNLMFKRTEQGDLCEVLFLDFQMPQYTVPAYDLMGLLGTMGDLEVRKRENEVIKSYHQKLVANLKFYGFKGEIPTVVDILVGLLKMSFQHAIYSLVAAPVFGLKNIELGDFFNPDKSEDVKKILLVLFKKQNFIDNIKWALDKFDMVGVFDE